MKAGKRGERMRLVVSKGGNSLAVQLILTPEGRAIGKAEIRRMREFIAHQKETAPAVDGMRKSARY